MAKKAPARTIEVDDMTLAELRALEAWLRGYMAAMPKDQQTGPPWGGVAVLDKLCEPRVASISSAINAGGVIP